MPQKKQKKRTSSKKSKQLKTNYSLVLFILFIGVSLGLIIGQNTDSTASLTEKITQIPNQIEKYINKNIEPKKQSNPKIKPVVTEEVTMRFLDIGQGDATLIQGTDGTNILIDTGRYDDKEKRIINYLNEYIGVGGKIDLLILTHNDSDHIGNADLVVEYFDVKKVWMNGHDTTTKVYEKVIDAIGSKNTSYEEPKSGETQKIGPFNLEVFNPTELAKSNQNDDSIITRISIGSFSSLFSGDAASRVEKEIIEKNLPVQSTLFHVGHHGSKESNSLVWLNKVKPELAIYSAGINNSYNHPSTETIERLDSLKIPTYGTDKNGTITVTIDKAGQYKVKTEKEP
ncbi:ComEC/Rec2 family competence protein [Carnobacterium gallinarum]|uniref:ComEC/Rec2 family competence protein n=1 Tax=Carnobacterium gallinarum TaxID=2749 RepID=UPI00055661CC|nr:ComEC/Rec2 family competence protein [Carnobacterium gallinarum]